MQSGTPLPLTVHLPFALQEQKLSAKTSLVGRPRRRGSKSPTCRITLVALGLAALTVGGSAIAQPATQATGVLRVRSTPHFSAIRVSPEREGQRVEGLLHDEQNAPVAGAKVQLPKGLRHRPCSGSSIVTDEQGHFCLWLAAGPDAAQLAFAGDEHFDPVNLQLSLQEVAPPPSLTVDTPHEWVVGRQDNTVRVLIDNAPAGSASQLRLRLLDAGGLELANFTAPVEGRTTLFAVAPEHLPAAGPLGVEVTLLSGATSELAKSAATIDLVAVVELVIHGLPESVRSGQEIAVTAEVTGDSKPLNSGWVEVRSNNQPLAIEPVRDGGADVKFELAGSREYTTQLSFQYVTEKPWFRPAPAALVPILVRGPLPWVHLPWAILAVAAGFWVMRTWRRPLRAVLQSLATASTGLVQSRIKQTSGPASAWSGLVRDAHDKQPLPGVMVLLHAPSLQAVSPLRNAVTDDGGRFVLDKVDSLPEGARLVFTSRTHSTLNQLAPGPCAMEVDLVDRRRTLLSAFHEWVAAGSLTRLLEPTPRDVVAHARRAGDTGSETWAEQVDRAVFGPTPPDGPTEEQLLRERPAPAQSGAKAR